jgi:hypothetical protein
MTYLQSKCNIEIEQYNSDKGGFNELSKECFDYFLHNDNGESYLKGILDSNNIPVSYESNKTSIKPIRIKDPSEKNLIPIRQAFDKMINDENNAYLSDKMAKFTEIINSNKKYNLKKNDIIGFYGRNYKHFNEIYSGNPTKSFTDFIDKLTEMLDLEKPYKNKIENRDDTLIKGNDSKNTNEKTNDTNITAKTGNSTSNSKFSPVKKIGKIVGNFFNRPLPENTTNNPIKPVPVLGKTGGSSRRSKSRFHTKISKSQNRNRRSTKKHSRRRLTRKNTNYSSRSV